MATLYQIDETMLRLLDAVEEQEGEITPEQEELLAITQDQFGEKTDSYVKVIRQMDADAKAFKEEADYYAKKAKAAQNKAKFLKGRLLSSMNLFGYDKFATDTFKLSVCKATAPTIEVESVSRLPEQYLRKLVEADKEAIKQDLLQGKEVEGCSMSYSHYLRIS